MRLQFTASLLLFFLLKFQNGYSQSTSLPKIIPPTPNAASLGKYGDIEVGLYTGQPNIAFPLYEIKYNDLTVPITLSYNYSGLRVEEYPGWVGAGWSILGNGVISRQTRSVPDESLNGYNGQNQNGSKVVNFISGGEVINSSNQAFLNGVRLGTHDSEPDIFTFSLPGLSGKFFFDESQNGATVKQATVIPHQKITVTGYFNYSAIYNIRPGIIEKFIIVDQKGIRYTFEVAEKAAGVEQGDPQEDDFASSWYLTLIETPNGNTVNYQYKYRVLDMPATLYERRTIPITDLTGFNLPSLSPVKNFTLTSTNEAILERIIFRGGSIDFIEGETRLDWNSLSWAYTKGRATEQPKTLSKIRVTQNGQLTKDVEFSYSYFGTETRLRLDSFRETNSGTANPPYMFNYQEGAFPVIGDEYSLYKQDHWGYYRGGSNSTMLPPYSQAFTRPDGSLLLINVPGNSREPNSIAASAGILNRITYPTGGYTSFQYEANTYWGTTQSQFNLCSGDFQSAANLRKSLTWGDQYDIDTLVVTVPTCMKLEYNLETPCVDGQAFVMLRNDQGLNIIQHIQEKKIWGIWYSDSGPANGETFALPPGTYYLSVGVINENTCGALTTSAATLFKIIQDSSGYANLKAGGLRIKTISACTDPQNCVTKYYTYNDINDPAQSSGRLINQPVYQYYLNTIVDNGEGTMTEVACSILNAQSQVPIASSSGGVIGYRYVTVTEELSGSKGKTVHRFSSAEEYPDMGTFDYPFPPRLSYDWKRSLPLIKTDYATVADTFRIISEQVSAYNFNSNYLRKISFLPKKIRDSHSSMYVITLNDFTFVSYFTGSGQANIFQQEEFAYDYSFGTSQSLSSNKTFYYENSAHSLPTRIESINSAGQSLKSTIKYIQDVNSVTGLTDPEKSGIQSNPDKTAVIEKMEFENDVLMSTERILYNGPKLARVLGAMSDNPLEEYFKVNQYDSKGNILNYTNRQGENTSYLYDSYQIFPIAEVKYANYENIFYTSFEDQGTIDASAKTGKRSYAGDYTFNPSSGFAVAPNSVISFWYWSNGSWFYKEQPYTGGSVTLTDGDKIDEVRVKPASAIMTTYTYNPDVGITSVTDNNNITLYYEYDNLGKLITVKDHLKKVVRNYLYNYKQ